jgi:hypothetical protein
MPGHKYSANVLFFLNLKVSEEEQAVYCLHQPSQDEKHIVDLKSPFQFTHQEPKTIKKLFPTISTHGGMEYVCCFEVAVFVMHEGYEAAINTLRRINESLVFDEKRVSSAYCTVDLNQDLIAFPLEKDDLNTACPSSEDK